jgi:hypothetical protein
VVLSRLPGAQLAPNLSLMQSGEAAAAGGGAAAAAAAATAAAGGSSSDEEGGRQDEAALDGQLLLVLRQPLRWGALKASGLLGPGDVDAMAGRLAAWRRVVGPTARNLLYLAPRNVL